MRIILFCCVIVSFTFSSAEVLIVGPCGGYPHPAQAFSDSAEGDTILITSGTYEFDESLMLFGTDNVTILGEDGTELLCSSRIDNVIWVMTSDNVVIKGLSMRHTDPAQRESCTGNVIGIDSCDDVTVEGCEINGCGAIGVYVFNCGDITLIDNFIHSNSIWAVQHEGYGLLTQSNELSGLVMEDNILINNGGRTDVEVLASGADDYVFQGIDKNNGLHYVFTVPATGLTYSYNIAPDCERLVLDIAMEPVDFIGRTMMVNWREIRCFNEITWDVDELTEITSVEILD